MSSCWNRYVALNRLASRYRVLPRLSSRPNRYLARQGAKTAAYNGEMNANPIADSPANVTRPAPNLTLHCGAHAVRIEQVSAVRTPEPTASWQPIPHDQLIRQVETTLEATHLRIGTTAHSLTRDGMRYF